MTEIPIMPFGKHAGTPISELPQSYLTWMSKNLSDRYLRMCADAVLAEKRMPTEEEAVYLDLDSEIIIIDAPFKFKDDIKTLPERSWNAEAKKWTSPLSMFDNLVEMFPEAQISSRLKDAAGISRTRQETLMKMSTSTDADIPVDDRLYPFQRAGVAFIEDTGGKCMIADEMGLGKSWQALTWLKKHPELRPAVIVCPASMKSAWKNFVKEVIGVDNVILSGTNPKNGSIGDITIVNYDILDAWKEKLYRSAAVVFDESHYIKSPDAQRSKAAKQIAYTSKHVVCLTGTPIMSKPIDLWQQLNVIDPITWNDRFKFGIRYADGKQVSIGGNKFWDFSGASNLEELADRLRSTIMIRRTKEQVLPDLPEKIYECIPVDITNRPEYDAIDDSDHPLAATNKQIMTSMRGKMKPVIRYIDDMTESLDKIVVFTWHHEMFDAVMEKFGDICVGLDSRTNQPQRDNAIEQFQNNPECKIFVGNIQAAGVGITLTAANHVVFTEIGWTPAEMDQATDRLHRIGQKNAVNVYYLIGSDTIDEHIYDTVIVKRKVFKKIMKEDQK